MIGARLASAAALGLALLLAAPPASAYCLTHGCNEGTEDCAYDADGCLVGGPLLHWDSLCISFDLQQNGSTLRGIDFDSARDAVHHAFAGWLNVDCGDGAGPKIRLEDFGPVECRSAEYNQKAGNANIVMFRDDDWPYEHAIDTLALTTLIFNADTGEIYDADIEVNTHDWPMSIGAIGPSDIDFDSVIAHEAGHFLGLSHSRVAGSTMLPSYAPGNTEMASLEADDMAGICAALPPDREPLRTSCEPRHGFSAQCALEESSCQLGRGRAGALGSTLLLAGALSSRALRRLLRRGRPRAAAPSPGQGRDSAS